MATYTFVYKIQLKALESPQQALYSTTWHTYIQFNNDTFFSNLKIEILDACK